MILARYAATSTPLTLAGTPYLLSAPTIRDLGNLGSALHDRFGDAPDSPDPDKDPDLDAIPRVRLGDPEGVRWLNDPEGGLAHLLLATGRREQPAMTLADWDRAIRDHRAAMPDDDCGDAVGRAWQVFRRLDTDDDRPDREYTDQWQMFRAYLRRQERLKSGRALGAGADDGGLEGMDFAAVGSCSLLAGLLPAEVVGMTLDQLEAKLVGKDFASGGNQVSGDQVELYFHWLSLPETQEKLKPIRAREEAKAAAWIAAHPEEAARNKAQYDYWTNLNKNQPRPSN